MGKHISRAELEACIALCERHLAGMQTESGNFCYEFDWEKQTYTDDDNAVRQAGTLWGLANLYRLCPDPALLENCRRGLGFYEDYSSTTAAGGRYATYPGQEHGYTGSTALVALALIELLRSPWNEDPALRQHWRRRLDEYLDFLVSIQLPDGRWPSRYDADTGHAHGEPSPISTARSCWPWRALPAIWVTRRSGSPSPGARRAPTGATCSSRSGGTPNPASHRATTSGAPWRCTR